MHNGVVVCDAPSSLCESWWIFPYRRGVSLFTFAAPFGRFKLAGAWNTSGAALAVAQRGVL